MGKEFISKCFLKCLIIIIDFKAHIERDKYFMRQFWCETVNSAEYMKK